MASWIVSSCLSLASSLVRVFTARSVVDSMSDSNFLTFSWSSFNSFSASTVPPSFVPDALPLGTAVRAVWLAHDQPLRAYPHAHATTPLAVFVLGDLKGTVAAEAIGRCRSGGRPSTVRRSRAAVAGEGSHTSARMGP